MIGQRMELTLHVDVDGDLAFQLPLLTDSLGEQLEIHSFIGADTTRSEGRMQVDHRYLITGFEEGSQVIPALPVSYEFRGRTDTALSMPVVVQVYLPEVDTTQPIRPIKPPINTPLSLREALPWIALGMGGLLLLVAVFFLVRYLRSRHSGEEGMLPGKPREPAHVIAFRELDELKAQKLWESGRVKQFYTRLTEISRQYIERQYAIPAMESTTDEILHAFRKSNPEDPVLDDMLKEVLELADLVKFAREDPLPVENQGNLNNVYLFVQKTYPLFEIKEDADE